MPEVPPRFRPEIAPQSTIRRPPIRRRPIGYAIARKTTARRRLIGLGLCLSLGLPGGPGARLSAQGLDGAADRARFLIIVLDAVPYASAVDFTSDGPGGPGLLSSLAGPVPLVSTFPSSTSVALTAILSRFGLEIPPGYENKFFDTGTGRVRGGTLGSYGKIRFDWHHFFDWQLRGFFSKSRAYAKPLKYNVLEIDRALEAFRRSDQKAFFVYVNSTDATGHDHGPEAMRAAFEHLDGALAQLRAESETPIHVVLLSDHGLGGGEPLTNVRKSVERSLRDLGLRIRQRLDRPGSVVLTPFGLVSSFEIYTQPGDEERVARAVAAGEGVALCAFPRDAHWVVVDRQGGAVIELRNGSRGRSWAYRPDGADPLRYADVVVRLKRSFPGRDAFPERAWFDATHAETYPDALFRLASSFELVQNPASVVCSVADGHLFGSSSASFGAKFSVGRLHWTHGALGRDETLGFLMTDFPGWTPAGAVRFDEALDFLADHLDSDSTAR